MSTISHHLAPSPIPSWAKDHYWVLASDWMREHLEVPTITMLVYLLVVFGGQRVMKNRVEFDLRGLLGFWNIILAAFSIAGVDFTLPSLLDVLRSRGIGFEACSTDGELVTPWVFFFCISKIPEFLDTFFIVLRKRELRFLHWYHHVATMWFCWLAWAVLLENGGLFAAMNLMVHSIMYSYYAASAFGVRFPNPIRIAITGLQILQMLLGTAIVLHNIIYCNTHPMITYSGLVMYVSYAVLFVDLFISSYCTKKPKSHTNGSSHHHGGAKVKAN